jgi:predicted nucleotide-binding protein (sugar kinase/HSP70/actin superfamily)
MDTTSCPIVAGTPEGDEGGVHQGDRLLRRRAGIEYVDHALTFTEQNLLKKPCFTSGARTWASPRTRATGRSSRRWAALDAFDQRMQVRGREVLERVERENKVAILLLGRPYHHDPGLHHGIPDEFQVRGYPILTIRSLPRDPAYTKRFFGDDDPFDITDVWPENYSANSSQKVWGARYAARHPHLAVLDLSSFKCGHDAPTYGIIDKIMGAAKVPYAALHDLDANKPGGSILIRVETFVHKLRLVEEELTDRARHEVELARKVADERERLRARILARRAAETTAAK